ncbi:MAG: methyltransferase domain-containing protein, partial [Armatimonadota bacterium]
SNGAFVAAALRRGLDAYGCDLNPDILQGAVELDGVLTGRLFACDLETGAGAAVPQLPTTGFRVLVLNDVIEHVVDPVAGLRALGQFRTDAGTGLVIDTPDAGGEQFRALGADWHHVRPLEHAYLFDLENLTRLVQEAYPTAELVDCKYPIPGKLVAYFRLASR